MTRLGALLPIGLLLTHTVNYRFGQNRVTLWPNLHSDKMSSLTILKRADLRWRLYHSNCSEPLPGDGFHDLTRRAVQPISAILAGGGEKKNKRLYAKKMRKDGLLEKKEYNFIFLDDNNTAKT